MKQKIIEALEEVANKQLNLASEAGRNYLADLITSKMVPSVLFDDDILRIELDYDVEGVPFVSLEQWEPLADDTMEAKDICTWGPEDVNTMRALANALLTAARNME